MLSFRHERFIAQAVHSALAQQTTFPIEILVGDDASPDRTSAILTELAQAHPNRLHLELRPENLGAHANFAALLASARGEYVALLEGDDYWVEPTKLQRQVDFLDAHPECSFCFHDVIHVDAKGSPRPRPPAPTPPPLSTTEDLLRHNYVPTCSAVFRRAAAPTIPASWQGLPMGDWPLWVQLSLSGTGAHLAKMWAHYRVHAGGMWSGASAQRQLQNVEKFYAFARTLLPPRHHALLARLRKENLSSLVELMVSCGQWPEARPFARRYLALSPRRLRAPAGRTALFYRLALNLPSAEMRALAQSDPMARHRSVH